MLDPVTHECIIATSLLVLGPYGRGSRPRCHRNARCARGSLEECVGVVGQTFLGLTVNCGAATIKIRSASAEGLLQADGGV